MLICFSRLCFIFISEFDEVLQLHARHPSGLSSGISMFAMSSTGMVPVLVATATTLPPPPRSMVRAVLKPPTCILIGFLGRARQI